jgi:cytochrome c551/c552
MMNTQGVTPVRRFLVALAVFAVGASLPGQQKAPAALVTSATLDKMIAANKSRKELSQYVFDNHGCKTCHVAGENGKLGFTEKGKRLTSGFEGCVRMLTAMNLIAQVPAAQRSADQKTKAQRFDEFGCTFCHQIVPGKMALTDLGSKLSHLHLGCADVEKMVASK